MKRLVTGKILIVLVMIINPNDGVGLEIDTNYQIQTKRSQAKNIKILGYIATDHAKENEKNRVQAEKEHLDANKYEIDQYIKRYDVDGFFFDQASTECKNTNYYEELNDYVKAKVGKPLTTIINPGTKTKECYINLADILVTFEDNFKNYDVDSTEENKFKGITWEANYLEHKFWHLILGTSEKDMSTAIELSKSRHAGYVYVTNDGIPNPWDTLPRTTYWEEEQKLVNQGSSTELLPAGFSSIILNLFQQLL